MLSLGIDRHSLLVYEGMFSSGRGIWPSPLVTSVAIESNATQQLKGPTSWETVGAAILFREDTYDPVARIRRGRFYKSTFSQPQTWQVPPHPAIPSQTREFGSPGVSPLELMTFTAHRISGDLSAIKDAQPLIILGDAQQFTLWTLVSIETSIAGEEIVAIRARSTFGALPHINFDRLSGSGKETVRSALDTLSEDLFRAGSESVIDRSREAITAALSTYLQERDGIDAGQDLGQLIRLLEKDMQNAGKKELVIGASRVVRQLHARGKTAEQEKRGVRAVTEQDAELAVASVGAILCDLGYAEWP